MSLFRGLFLSAQDRELIELASYHCPDIAARLNQSRARVIQFARMSAPQWLKIAHDCEELINNTVKPDVYFSRFRLYESVYACLALVEPYLSFSGTTPTAAVKLIQQQRPASVRAFIDRSYQRMIQEARAMKTKKGQDGRLTRYFDTMEQYAAQLGPDGWAHLQELKARHLVH